LSRLAKGSPYSRENHNLVEKKSHPRQCLSEIALWQHQSAADVSKRRNQKNHSKIASKKKDPTQSQRVVLRE
jgi:hypothetical protein